MAEVVPVTGVWWDINTCPVPDGYDPGCVRQSIESALANFMGPSPVIIFCYGNLEYVPPLVLKAISDSGILLRHALGWSSLSLELFDWKDTNPSATTVLFISGDDQWWYMTSIKTHFSRTLRAFPDLEQPVAYPADFFASLSAKKWVWKDLLEEKYSGPCYSDTTGQMDCVLNCQFEWWCSMCMFPGENCSDFIDHLKSVNHRQELFGLVWPWDGNPVDICELCDYPYVDDKNMRIHLESEEHAHNVKAAGPSASHETEAIFVDNSKEYHEENSKEDHEEEDHPT
ncbi:unnamed protein product [Thlaspi arvense]|uniref:NYN domain-containing protein n=1 Tax=Thlaspi arvense TaxID=13288 RepID=A0AAU9RBR1_THLAR|nr:unnamed protein product [Thlaspi arvense]